MIRNRHQRLITVLFALVSLLFMQLAVAGYICPGSGSKIAEAAAMAEAGMSCAESMPLNMDDQQPNLCQAHCQAGHQSADKHELSSPVAISALPANFSLQIALPVFSEAPLQAPHLQRTTAPPVAIRNCCFRL
ncbi:hypothetical protein [Thermomonas sp.]|jgi:hypothetical protein|uniref:hypothetical protein n=1 Tax=Thermomonas sp. TaxID=1971895 RepID=UPI002488A352|nr:hypothetical protein [Thermomonas sp.]MDI1252475.1 hypothetical protein [Thermomonas sp.]